MDRIIESLSSAALVPALEANMVEFWSAHGRAPQQASEMGFPVNRRLGFQEVCTFGLYLWPGVMHPSGETTHGR